MNDTQETITATESTDTEAKMPVESPTPLDLEALESMLADAEQRGYERARSEIATAEMNAPAVGDQPSAPVTEVTDEPFLSHRRRSVWDY
ncbi:MAG: hypothetical protein K2O00_02205 [Muribaculaceae bacterium]|nr:hypothetical protein [Muribaculaceae bacterium]